MRTPAPWARKLGPGVSRLGNPPCTNPIDPLWPGTLLLGSRSRGDVVETSSRSWRRLVLKPGRRCAPGCTGCGPMRSDQGKRRRSVPSRMAPLHPVAAGCVTNSVTNEVPRPSRAPPGGRNLPVTSR
jgi:hypothetical protein